MGSVSVIVQLALLGFVPFAVALFAFLPPRRAVLAGFILGWLFLPVAGISLPGLPDYTKQTATSAGPLLGVLLFDSVRLLSWRPRWFDVPMVVWCTVPLVTSFTNGLGPYDGMGGVVRAVFNWGVPYVLGRIYFGDLQGARALAMGIVVGGLLYVPLCWLEIRLSPQLHKWVYGYHQHQFAQSRRGGGYRPTVFMQHGIAVGMWMTAASLISAWMWHRSGARRFAGMSMGWVVAVLWGTTIMVKSLGAFALLIGGIASLKASTWSQRTAPLVAVMAVALAYTAVRTTGLWDGSHLVEVAHSIAGQQRADSLSFRLRNEGVLVERALQRPIFGWGGWGRNRPEESPEKTITDGMWIIAFGQNGLVGLAAFVGFLVAGYVLMLRHVPVAMWAQPAWAAPAALAMLLALVLIDNLFNAHTNPIFLLAAGGLPGVVDHAVRRTAGASAHAQNAGGRLTARASVPGTQRGFTHY